jgi:hypothetical protein
LIRKRKKPRRGRIVDKKFRAWMATQPCCVTGILPATTHHVRSFGSPKNDHRAIRLIPALHQLTHDSKARPSIERIGKEAFEHLYHINIEDEILKANKKYEQVQLDQR